MTKSECLERLQAFMDEILQSDDEVDEYEFRNLAENEIIKGIEDYLFD